MLLIISLVLAFAFVFFCGKMLKKHPVPFYVGAAAVTAALALIPTDGVPDFVNSYIINLFRRGTLATALFIIVMYTGALKNGSALMKRLIVIRGELSITASIMILCHNIFFGKTYFVRLFTSAGNMSVTQLLAAIASILMLLIMIPLAVMSFPKVRKRMKPKLWKRLQRFAYAFYALIYVHVFLLTYASAQAGRDTYIFNLIAYTVVFGVYLVMRVRKYLLKKNPKLQIALNAGSSVCAAALVGSVCLFVFLAGGNTSTVARSSARTSAHTSESSVSDSYDSTEGSVSSLYDSAESSDSLHTIQPKALAPNGDNVSEASEDSETTSAESEEAARESSATSASTSQSSTSTAQNSNNSSSKNTQSTQSVQSSSNNSNNSASSSSSSNKSSSTKSSTSSSSSKSSSTSSSNKSSSTKSNTSSSSSKSSSSTSSKAAESSAEPVKTTVYKDGTFSGTAYGYDGDIYVTITIKDDKITNIQATSDESDQWYFESARDNVISQILSSQSTDVDATSGATYSSYGIMDAVANALKSAKN